MWQVTYDRSVPHNTRGYDGLAGGRGHFGAVSPSSLKTFYPGDTSIDNGI